MFLVQTVAPSTEPLTLAEARAHLREPPVEDNAYISSLIVAARQGAEHMTGRALLPQTLELGLDAFDPVIRLPRPPLASVTSVKYIDSAGAEQTLAAAAYRVGANHEPARIAPAYGLAWPVTRTQQDAVTIRYVAGYANAAAVPQELKCWMLLRIGLLYENRESVVVGASLADLPYVDRLLDAYRVWGF